MPYYISPPPQNPLSRLIAAVVAVFALVVSFMIGMAALLVVGGIVIVAGIAIWLRVAWIKRRLRKSGVDLGVNRAAGEKPGNVIDAEYTVVSDSKDEQNKQS